MCTATWINKKDSYRVFFNRDELKTRGPEVAPEVYESRGVRFIAPLDGDTGGTWCGVNEYALTLCLTNYYLDLDASKPAKYISRGLLLKSLMHSAALDKVTTQLESMTLISYKPFRLLGFQLGTPVFLWVWNSKRLSLIDNADDRLPVISSSFRQHEVEASRREYFRRLTDEKGAADERLLDQYQKSQVPRRSAFSVCMERADAKTFSYSRVKADPATVEYIYNPRPLENNPAFDKSFKLPVKRLALSS